MKFVCDRAELNDALQMLVGVVDPRHIKELLRSIRVQARKDAVVLVATDLEVGMRYTLSGVEVEEPGEIILPADRLANIVRESRDEKLLFNVEDGSCLIEGKDSRFHVLGSRGEEFPDVPAFPENAGLDIEGAIVREMVRKTAFSTAPEKMRYALNGVLLAVKENSQQVDMVATDGRQLAWIKRKANKRSKQTAEVIVPTKGALQLEHMVAETEVVKVHLEERHIFAKTADAELVAQLVDGMFPNFREVIPKDLDKKVEIAADALTSGVRRASLLSSRDEDTRAINLALTPNKLILTSSAPDAGDAKVELDIEYSGEEVKVDLNPDYVMDGLKVLGNSMVTLELRDSTTPCVVKHGKDYLYLTMPIT